MDEHGDIAPHGADDPPDLPAPARPPSLTAAGRMVRHRAKRRAAGLPAPAKPRTRAAKAARKASRKAHRRSPAGQASEARRRRTRRDERPFVAVDGEGAGTDALGRQHYMLLRAGDRELFTGKPLSTVECLGFLCDGPPGQLMVGFSFGYDVTMILRDLPSARRDYLLKDKPQGKGVARYTYWQGFGIEYLPRNYFRVCRSVRVRDPGGDPARDVERPVKGTARTVWETFGFFQQSFVSAIGAFECGTAAQRESIARNKARRGAVSRIGAAQRRYCALECELLSEMMGKFRLLCVGAGIRPRTWSGAGKLSAALHAQHGTITAARVAELVPAPVLAMASAAYYGGRFEITRVGAIPGPLYAYDIRSAYPAAMRALPCLEHGGWEPASGARLRSAGPDALWLAPVRFRHDDDPARTLCGLPVRQKSGRLFWPRRGGGVYWSPEIRAAARLGCHAAPGDGWLYARRCDCRPFDWVERLYDYRRGLPGLRGYPIKLAINGLYGKLAQRIGHPKWSNLIWAGLTTALARAQIMAAAAADPDAIAMIATDALFATRALSGLAVGTGLGAWERTEHADGLFVVMPGLYWAPRPPDGGGRKLRTRGTSASQFAAHTETFEAAWAAYAAADRAAFLQPGAPDPPVVEVAIELFTGIKIAQARGKPETAGRWTREPPRRFSFAWGAKRSAHAWEGGSVSAGNAGGHARLSPPWGSAGLWSVPHKGSPRVTEALDAGRAEFAEQPDHVDLSSPEWG